MRIGLLQLILQGKTEGIRGVFEDEGFLVEKSSLLQVRCNNE